MFRIHESTPDFESLVLTEHKNNIFINIGRTKKKHGPNSPGTSRTQRPSSNFSNWLCKSSLVTTWQDRDWWLSFFKTKAPLKTQPKYVSCIHRRLPFNLNFPANSNSMNTSAPINKSIFPGLLKFESANGMLDGIFHFSVEYVFHKGRNDSAVEPWIPLIDCFTFLCGIPNLFNYK